MTLERHFASLSPSGFHRLAYREWPGPPDAPTLVCVHGLSRNAHDFDVFAEAMAPHYRGVCPDMPGRGESEWLANSAEYAFPTYVADCAALIARLDVEAVDWVGTSMGALIGLLLAAQPGAPIRKLVVNDAGPLIPKAALAWLGTFIGADPTFPTLEAMEAVVRVNSAGFGALTDAQWRKMTRDHAREKPGGGFGYAYDPRIGDPYKQDLPDADPARRRVERAGPGRRGGDDREGAEGEARRISRRRPRARSPERGSDRRGAGLSDRLRRAPTPSPRSVRALSRKREAEIGAKVV